MKKNLIILENSNIFTEELCKNFKKKNIKIIILNNNVYKLKHFKNTLIYPFNKSIKDLKILMQILKNTIKILDSIIINTSIPNQTKPIEQITDENWIEQINQNINIPFSIIKNLIPLLKKSKNPNISIIIHKNPTNIKAYWSTTECINHALISLMETIHDEYKNINNLKINCISTENINSLYKKNIYPYKTKTNYKNLQQLINKLIYLMKNNVKNKIIKI